MTTEMHRYNVISLSSYSNSFYYILLSLDYGEPQWESDRAKVQYPPANDMTLSIWLLIVLSVVCLSFWSFVPDPDAKSLSAVLLWFI